MLISPTSPTTAYLATRINIIDTKSDSIVNNVYSFDTKTKEAEVFIMNENGEVKIDQKSNKPLTKKEKKENWIAVDKYTGKAY